MEHERPIAMAKILRKIILMRLDGYFGFIMRPDGFVNEFVLAAYLVISVFDCLRIRGIPCAFALKNRE